MDGNHFPMQRQRPLAATNPRHFGRGRALTLAAPAEQRTAYEDLQLFAATFAGGFVFVSILIG
jgi:hypothetical protein